jgi:SAM-dependent methyltransferase
MADTPPAQPPAGSSHWDRPDDSYVTRPPWDIGRPQPAFVALADAGELRGRVLDVGCGTGEHVLMCAARGLDATGLDLAGTALRTAEEKAAGRGLTARFVRHDARQLGELGEEFDTVVDCGLLHLFDARGRAAVADGVRAVLRPGGRYFVLGFSDREPGDWGPHRLTREEIGAALAGGWRIDAAERTTLVVDFGDGPRDIQAWLVTATRL